jgi:outer membrane protein assembly factor BamB
VAVAALLAAAASLADDWSAYRGGSARSGATAESVAPPFAPLWSVPVEGRILAPPVAAAGRVYAGTDAGRLYAFDAADGRILWDAFATGPIEGSPALDGGTVYVGSLGGDLLALHAETGETIWRARHGGAQEGPPLVLPDRVVVAVGGTTRELRAYAKADGTPLWTFTARYPLRSAGTRIRVAGRDVVVAGDTGGVWSAIDSVAGPAPGGLPQWSFLVPTGRRAPTAAATGEDARLAVCAGGADRRLYVVDVEAGAVVHRIPLPPPDAAAEASAAEDFAALLALPDGELERLFDGKAGDPAAALDLAELLLGSPLDALRDALADAAEAEAFPPVFDGRSLYALRRERRDAGEVLVLTRADAGAGAVDSWWISGPLPPDPGPIAAPVLTGGRLLLTVGSEVMTFDVETLYAGPVDTLALPAPAAAAPAASDGRLFVAGADGILHAFAGTNRPPDAPILLAPADGADVASHYPVLHWSEASDPDATDAPETLAPVLEYRIEPGGALADGPAPALDGAAGVIRLALPAGTTDHALVAPVTANARVAWRVRVRDAAGAVSPWSATASFLVHYDPLPPDPPTGLTVLPLNGAVQLGWSESASPDVVGYNIYCQDGGAGFAQAEVIRLGTVTAASVGSLVNGTAYDFLVTAVDGAGNESAGRLVAATPQSDILLEGRDGFLTVQHAIDAAVPGETVTLGPKTFRVAGGLVLKGGVSLRGYAPHLTILDGQGAPAVLRLDGTAADGRVAIERLTVTGGGAGIDTGDADVRLSNLQIVRLAGPGIVTGPMAAVEGTFLTVADNTGDGIAVRTPLAAFRGVIAARNGGSGVSGPAGTSVTHSTFYDNVLGDASGPDLDSAPDETPRENLSLAVAFRDPEAYDYRERTGDAVVDAADPDDPWEEEPEPNGLRANQGAFGNTPYAAKSLDLPLAKPDRGADGADPVWDDDEDSRPLCFVASSAEGAKGGTAWPLLAAALLLAAGFSLRRRRA